MNVTINGKTVGIKFNNYAVERFAEIFSKISGTSLAEPYSYVYAGYLGWKFVKEEFPGSTFIAPVIEFEDVVDWVDDCVGNPDKIKELQAINKLVITNSVMAKAYADAQKKTEMHVNEEKSEIQPSTPTLIEPTITSSPSESSDSTPMSITV